MQKIVIAFAPYNSQHINILRTGQEQSGIMSGYEMIDAANCLVRGPDGVEYQEFMCRFPALEPLYFW